MKKILIIEDGAINSLPTSIETKFSVDWLPGGGGRLDGAAGIVTWSTRFIQTQLSWI